MLIAVPPGARAVDRYVPAGGENSYATVQEALDASLDGDVVIVQPGVYTENLVFRRRAIDVVLTSTDPDDPATVAATVLDGGGAGSVVTILEGRTPDTVVTGFTIRNGSGTPLSADATVGGGIYCDESSPTITGNTIETNSVPNNPAESQGLGGGLMLRGSRAVVVRNRFVGNGAFAGGAVFVAGGRPVFSDNIVTGNSATAGAGIFAQGDARIWNNTFAGNTADAGAHLTVFGARPEVINNVMAFGAGGGGTYLAGGRAQPGWILHNNSWSNEGGNFLLETVGGPVPEAVPVVLDGHLGNFSLDPAWTDAAGGDYRLTAGSPCINAGLPGELRDPAAVDFGGAARQFSARVDLGAHEFAGAIDFAPIADAGSDRSVSAGEEAVSFDGSGSIDPEGAGLSYRWEQVAGEAAALTGETTASLQAVLPGPGEFTFALVVNDGARDSLPDRVTVRAENLPPVASAGIDAAVRRLPARFQLDGSFSVDPEGAPLGFEWRQVAGPSVALDIPESARPVFHPTVDGTYRFELVVTDVHGASSADEVTYHLGAVAPVADAGLPRYTSTAAVQLDGTGSWAPNPAAGIAYQWRQVDPPGGGGGGELTIVGADTATPTISGFTQSTTDIQEATFELVVTSAGLASQPSQVRVVTVPRLGNTQLRLQAAGFDPDKPTIVSFGGGDCDTGGSLSPGGRWRTEANLFTVSYSRDRRSPAEAPEYFGYGDQLIVMLSEFAPDYSQPVQTVGFSTGNMPAFDVALRINTVYRDPRYAVNRITMLDSGCNGVRDYAPNIATLKEERLDGEQFWIDNYYSEAGRFRPGVFNVEFPVPPATHSDPNNWYPTSWQAGQDEGVPESGIIAGLFFSAAGPGRYYQLDTSRAEYHLGWETDLARFPVDGLTRVSPFATPALLPGTVTLSGPEDGALAGGGGAGGVLLSCEPVQHAERYQVVVGTRPDRVDHVVHESAAPPTEPVAAPPFAVTYWSVRAVDAFGSYSYGAPRLLLRDTDGDAVTDHDEGTIYRTDPRAADTDGDGATDGQEVAAGTHPLFPGSAPGGGSVEFDLNFAAGAGGGGDPNVTLRWLGQPGRTYQIEAAAGHLGAADWTPVGQVTAPDDPGGGPGPVELEFEFTPSAATSGFFRIALIE